MAELHHFLLLLVAVTVADALAVELCSQTLLTGPGAIPDDHITASSTLLPPDPRTHTGPERARLFSLATTLNNGTRLVGGWAPATDKQGEYIQANFDDMTMIKEVVTQGRNLGNGHVTSYRVEYTEDGTTWKPVVDGTGAVKKFNGNNDANTPSLNKLDCPVFAKGIRIYPLTWDSHIALRFDLLGCHLDDTGPGLTTPITTPTTPTTPTTTPTTTTTTPSTTPTTPSTTTTTPSTTPKTTPTTKPTTTPTTPTTTPTTPTTTPTTPTTTPTTPVTTPTTTPSTTTDAPFLPGIPTPFGHSVTTAACLKAATDCQQKPDGDYQFCLGCSEYVTCTNGFFYTRRCPNPTLHWDDTLKKCVLNSQTCI